MPKFNTHCLPNTHGHTQETRTSNNISGTFQHFLLKEEASSATTDLTLCLLELMKKMLVAWAIAAPDPTHRPGLAQTQLTCKGSLLPFAKGFQRVLTIWNLPKPFSLVSSPLPHPQIKSTKDIKKKGKEASLETWNLKQRQIYLRKCITVEDTQYLLEKEFFTILKLFC